MNTNWRRLWLLSFLIIANYGGADAAKKRICVIGTGVVGVATLKRLSLDPENIEPIAFEKRSDVGGLWIYSENTDVDEFGLPASNNMYTYLRTNGPKDTMLFPDYKDFNGENRSYVTHMDVLQYIRNYTEHFNVRRFIQFRTLVEKVTPLSDERNTQWNVRTRNLVTDEVTETICDAVIVCNGHYSKIHIPDIPGLDTFPGKVIHSIAYRRPQDYKGQKVLVMGSGSSGTDIGLQISWYADKVYLSHRHKLGVEIPKNMEEVPALVAVNGNEMKLSDGTTLTADAIVFCTGYDYDFPFLTEDSGIAVEDGKYIRGLYKHLVNIEHPTMAFPGLPYPSIPFSLPYIQAEYFVSMLLGKIRQPSREEMLKASEIPQGASKLKDLFMAEESLYYYNELADLVNVEPIDRGFEHFYRIWAADKKSDLLHFKDKDTKFFEDGHFEFVRQYYPIYGVDIMSPEELDLYLH